MRLPALLCTLSLAAFTGYAADAPKPATPKAPAPKNVEPPVYMTVETAGPDFPLQGEYAGEGLGADIIALGDGNFRLVLHKGGLPGAGWDASAKTEVEAKRDGDAVRFKDLAELKGGVLTVGATSLKRIERHSPTEGAKAPAGAVILFDGSNADAWNGGHLDERKLLAAGTTSKQVFQSFTLHLEFLLPFKPLGRGQGRANSGVYVQNRYEVQVLDSFGLKGLDNECGGVYQNSAPKVNMCFPPLQWQTYDIEFTAAKFGTDGKKTDNSILTVKHNGVVVQDKLSLKGATPGGGFKTEVPAPGPFQLQGHGNPVYYRNVWIVEQK
ncbi:MAG: DUF1080 domain-containing protein [Verrucomicrobiota bacterium]